ncbi:MAG: isopenicillin N synthase family dioxygenase [Acetobacteraceae bacterium]
MSETLREIDLTGFAVADQARRRCWATEIAGELSRLGFFVVTGHGVSADLIEGTLTAATAFFDLPLSEKMRIKSTVQGSPRGYLDFGLETLALSAGVRTPPDLKEGFGMGPLRVACERDVLDGLAATYTPNVWPDRPANFRAIVTAYYREMERLMDVLMELFAIGMELPPRFFVDRFADHNSTLRLNHYPAQPDAPETDQLRAGAHTDYGALTILLGQDRPGGLQVRTPDGGWIDARTNPHSFVINIGDLMMRWSNDTWLSNRHRVVNPPPGSGEVSRRLSFAYFCNPNDDLLIECLPSCQSAERPPKYPPIRAGEHRYCKIEASKKALAA